MKKSVALILAASTWVLAGCSTVPHVSTADAERSAIEAVLAQRAEVKARDGQVGLLGGQRVAELKAIDVRNCPADFRSAWFDYLVEVENLSTKVERVFLLESGEGTPAKDLLALMKLVAANPTIGQYLIVALDRVDEAWGKLERTAMNYAVMPQH